MDEPLLAIFKAEVAYNCELGLAGGRILERARQEAIEGGGIRAEDSMWFALQGILSVGANLAKLLGGWRVRIATELLRNRHQKDLEGVEALQSGWRRLGFGGAGLGDKEAKRGGGQHNPSCPN